MVGLQGSGKTTSSAKLARYLVRQGRRPLLVAADPYRPAAADQLETLGKSLDIPVYLCIPIAASGDEHVGVLSALAEILVDGDNAAALRGSTDVDDVLARLNPRGDAEAGEHGA